MSEYTFSLMEILRNDPDYAGALSNAKEDVRKIKLGLLEKSQEYCNKFEKEIEEGDKLRYKLLTEGKSQGKTEDQILSGYGKFLPSKHTPIMNLLFFLMREENIQQKPATAREVLEDYCKQFGYDINEVVKAYMDGVNIDMPQGYDDKNTELEDVLTEASETPEEFDTYIYGSLSINEFKKLKKLKALSYSDNLNEASAAHLKLLKLCKEHNLDPEKVPCNRK